MHRAESPMMRALRQLDYDRRHMSVLDRLAMLAGYLLLLAIGIIVAVSVVDWIQGDPTSLVERIDSLLAWIDRP